MLADLDQVPLVGRTDELRRLMNAFADLEQDRTVGVFVTGESGIGKSRLLAETAERFRTRGAAVLSGSCIDIGPQSYFTLRQAVYRSEASPTGVRDGSAAYAVLIDLLSGDGGHAIDHGEQLDQLARTLQALSREQPLVWMIDDLQWADRGTLQLLLYLLTGFSGGRVLIIAAVRAEGLTGDSELRRILSRLRPLPFVRIIELGLFNRIHTDELATAVVGVPLAKDVSDLVWSRSGGNAFLVGELAKAAGDVALHIPDTLREIVLVQVGELPPSSRRVLAAISVGTEPVAHSLLANVLPMEEQQLFDAVGAAVNHLLIRADEDG